MPFQSNAVLCRSAAKVLTLGKTKKILVFLSLNRTFATVLKEKKIRP